MPCLQLVKKYQVVARTRGLEARGWSRQIEEDDTVLVSHFACCMGIGDVVENEVRMMDFF